MLQMPLVLTLGFSHLLGVQLEVGGGEAGSHTGAARPYARGFWNIKDKGV